MSFFELYTDFKDRYCFNIHEVEQGNANTRAIAFSRWVRSGKLMRLYNGWYCFPDALQSEDGMRVIASQIYKPSYISFEYALHLYGAIPELIPTITCATGAKTMVVETGIRKLSYTSIKPAMFFGYSIQRTAGGTYLIATPEKALADFLYIHNGYRTSEDMEGLRLDEYFMENELRKDMLLDYVKAANNRALSERVETLFSTYGI